MDVEKLDDGLWRWTGHVDGGPEVVSLYLEVETTVVLMDPVLPLEDRERFLEALDRDVARLGGAVRIALTRETLRGRARELAERYDACIWSPGDETRPPHGVEVVRRPGGDAVLFWIPAYSTLFTGDEAVRVVSATTT
jgi:hypothetical protein